MDSFFEEETAEHRLQLIESKLSGVPLEDEDTKQYYVFYKEDVRFLLELMEGIKNGSVFKGSIQNALGMLDELDQQIAYDACKTYEKDHLIKQIRAILTSLNPQ